MNLISQVEETIQKAQTYGIHHQYPEGYWRGSLQTNNSMEAEYIFLKYFLGKHDIEQESKIIKRILDCQREDGTWGMYYQSRGDLSITIECYFALKLSGINIQLPHMKKAREFILAYGGVENARTVTKIFLALFGEWPWAKTPPLRPEIILLPNWFYINIYEFSYWARVCLLPLSIILSQRPTCPIPKEVQIRELFLDVKKSHSPSSLITRFFNKFIGLYDKSPFKPGRGHAINSILVWMLERQQNDGTWGGVQFSLAYLIALKSLGYDSNHPVIAKWLEGFIQNYTYEINGALSIEGSNSTIWDTCVMINSLIDSDMSVDHPAIQKGIKYLIHKQNIVKGDWKIKNPSAQSGGWSYQFYDTYYPDIDVTAEVLIVLFRYSQASKPNRSIENAIDKGKQWILSMQSKNGGWAFHDKDNTNKLLARISNDDFGELLDVPTINVTAHVVFALACLGYTVQNRQIDKAVKFIFKKQEPDGSWFGHWYVNYIYGTAIVLIALSALNFNSSHPALRRGSEWLISKQNPDGGWGESPGSYFFIDEHGKGESTASQTAWALLGLMAVGMWQHPSVTKGIEYLCTTCQADGIWDESYYTASAIGKRPQRMKKDLKPDEPFPIGFMLKCDLYRHYWPLRALGQYKKFLKR